MYRVYIIPFHACHGILSTGLPHFHRRQESPVVLPNVTFWPLTSVFPRRMYTEHHAHVIASHPVSVMRSNTLHAMPSEYITSHRTAAMHAVSVLCLWLQPALEELALQNVGCSVNACKSLAELIQNAQDLRTLRLYNNMSDDAGATSIAEVFTVSSIPASSYPSSPDPLQSSTHEVCCDFTFVLQSCLCLLMLICYACNSA